MVIPQSSNVSANVNPLTASNQVRSCSEGQNYESSFSSNKENTAFNPAADTDNDKENLVPPNGSTYAPKWNANLKSFSTKATCEVLPKESSNLKSLSTGRALKQTSLQLCMQMNDGDKIFGTRIWDCSAESEHSSSLKIWEHSDSEAAPASSWSTLPNRTLLCKPLPIDVGRCTCVIVQEGLPEGLSGGFLYALYTNEGRGRKDRKLAVAYHKRRDGKSVFTVAQNIKGILSNADDSYVGVMTANLAGSKYHIWDQGARIGSLAKQSSPVLSVIAFTPTIATWTGSYRSMRAYIPKHQALQGRNVKQAQNVNRLPKDWQRDTENVQKLCSRAPQYNSVSKQYELDFRDRGRARLRIQSSVKNFQLTHEGNKRQTILQMGRVDKLKYVIDFRCPLMGYQAFCISLASIDSKLCCAI